MSTLTTSIQIVLEVAARAIGKKKAIQIGKEEVIKLCLFADDMIFAYRKSSNEILLSNINKMLIHKITSWISKQTE